VVVARCRAGGSSPAPGRVRTPLLRPARPQPASGRCARRPCAHSSGPDRDAGGHENDRAGRGRYVSGHSIKPHIELFGRPDKKGESVVRGHGVVEFKGGRRTEVSSVQADPPPAGARRNGLDGCWGPRASSSLAVLFVLGSASRGPRHGSPWPKREFPQSDHQHRQHPHACSMRLGRCAVADGYRSGVSRIFAAFRSAVANALGEAEVDRGQASGGMVSRLGERGLAETCGVLRDPCGRVKWSRRDQFSCRFR
jgi:hypothetical protein